MGEATELSFHQLLFLLRSAHERELSNAVTGRGSPKSGYRKALEADEHHGLLCGLDPLTTSQAKPGAEGPFDVHRIPEPDSLARAWEEPGALDLDELKKDEKCAVVEHKNCASPSHFVPSTDLCEKTSGGSETKEDEECDADAGYRSATRLTQLLGVAARFSRASLERNSTRLDDFELQARYNNLMCRYDSTGNRRVHEMRKALNQRRLAFNMLVHVKESFVFNVFVNGSILINIVFIAIERDFELKRVHSVARGVAAPSDMPSWLKNADLIFIVIFSFELLIRIFAEEGQFCFGDLGAWNLFDLVLVIVSAVEIFLSELELNASFARLLRLLRLCRALKVMRMMRGLGELRLMLQSILAIVPTLFWSMLFMVLIMLLVALLVVSGVADFINQHPDIELDPFEEYFSSVLMTLLTLFMCVCDGVGWWDVVDPMLDASLFYGLLIILYVYIIKLGILNVVTSIFLHNSNMFAQTDLDSISAMSAQQNAYLLKRLVRFFDTLDEDGNGTLTIKEFNQISEDPKARAFFEEVIGINIQRVADLFNLLDQGCDGVINREEFVVGCMQVKGGSKNHDAQMQLGIAKGIARDVSKLNSKLRGVAQTLDILCSTAQANAQTFESNLTP